MPGNNHPRITILVACHKSDPNIRQSDIYMPIHVGKALVSSTPPPIKFLGFKEITLEIIFL